MTPDQSYFGHSQIGEYISSVSIFGTLFGLGILNQLPRNGPIQIRRHRVVDCNRSGCSRIAYHCPYTTFRTLLSGSRCCSNWIFHNFEKADSLTPYVRVLISNQHCKIIKKNLNNQIKREKNTDNYHKC